MNRKKIFQSIQMNMILNFSVLILLAMLFFMIFSIEFTKDNLVSSVASSTQELIEQVSVNIDDYIDTMYFMSEGIAQRDDFAKMIKDGVPFSPYNELDIVMNRREDIYNIALLGVDGYCFFSVGEMNPHARITEKEWFQEALASSDEMTISSHVQNMVAGEYRWVVSNCRKIYDEETGELLGLLVIDMNYESITEICDSVDMGEQGYIYILGEDGGILYHPQQQLILSGVKYLEYDKDRRAHDMDMEQQKKLGKIYAHDKCDFTEWTIVGVVYIEDMIENEDTINQIYACISFALILLASGLAFVFSRKITKPIKKLEQTMTHIQSENFVPVYLKPEGKNEIVSLYHSYNHLMEYIDELIKANEQKHMELKKSELQALQAQISPHFLYNTLDSIIWMIEMDSKDGAIEMTAALAHFFRRAIGNTDLFVSINEELEYTRQYLIIQRMRYQDKLDFVIEVDDDILSCTIVKLVLQPLVENALYHGLKYKKEKGLIRIYGYRCGDRIQLVVEDNGCGMEQSVIDNIFEEKVHVSSGKGNGIGVKNIQSRIQLYYGKEYGLSIESKVNVGTRVTLMIPCKENQTATEVGKWLL